MAPEAPISDISDQTITYTNTSESKLNENTGNTIQYSGSSKGHEETTNAMLFSGSNAVTDSATTFPITGSNAFSTISDVKAHTLAADGKTHTPSELNSTGDINLLKNYEKIKK